MGVAEVSAHFLNLGYRRGDGLASSLVKFIPLRRRISENIPTSSIEHNNIFTMCIRTATCFDLFNKPS